MTIQHLRSSTANKRPTAAAMSDGQLAVNTNATNPGLFFKDADGSVRKVGPVFIGSSAPNSSPATGGSTGHAVGEQWLDNTGGTYVLKIWDGTAWRSESGTFVDVSGDNMTGNLTLGSTNIVLNASNGNITSVGSATFNSSIQSGEYASGAAGSIQIFNNTASTQAFKIGNTTNGSNIAMKPDGSATFASNVGIGNSSPSSYNSDGRNLVVGSGSGGQGLSIASGTSSYGTIYFADGTSGDALYRGSVLYNHASDFMRFDTAANERMRIDSSGRLLLGTTTEGHANADDLTVSASGDAGITIRSGASNYGSIFFSDATSGSGEYVGAIQYNHSSNFLTIGANGSERMRIDSAGKVSIGSATSALASQRLTINYDTNSSTFSECQLLRIDGAGVANEVGGIGFGYRNSSNSGEKPSAFIGNVIDSNSGAKSSHLVFATRNATTDTEPLERLRIDSSGRVGIGTTSANGLLTLQANSGRLLTFRNSTTGTGSSDGSYVGLNGSDLQISNAESANTIFYTSDTERLRIDSSGRLLVGTSSDPTGGDTNAKIAAISSGPGGIYLGRSDGATASGRNLGQIVFRSFAGSAWQSAASIQCFSDGTSGSGDKPGRLLFATTADGTSSPTERMRITSNGFIQAGTTSTDGLFSSSINNASASAFFGEQRNGSGNGSCAIFNRSGSDGTLIAFKQAGSSEGSISVSGTTVSYNGGHLARWSQLTGGAERIEILRGSVLSNLDEMCEWGEEDNEQLNRMKVSDVEGDRNVSGVFQAWDDDDDTYTNDFYCAMTGDFVIRVAAGTTVERGDLLMSAGDGTAKPQDDDIVRSKTIAKVTSTVVSETYADGSYCVPCVLMAC